MVERVKRVMVGLRTAGKQRRRNDILAAAHRLLDEDGLSMRALSAKAGVSLVTPYNLFGSKDALLNGLAKQNQKEFCRLTEQLVCADSLERIFATLELAREFYAAEPTFHRGMIKAMHASQDPAFVGILNRFRTQHWQDLLDACVREKLLVADLDTAKLAQMLIHILHGILQRWVRDEIDVAQVHADSDFGFTLCLLGVSTPASYQRLYDHRAALCGSDEATARGA